MSALMCEVTYGIASTPSTPSAWARRPACAIASVWAVRRRGSCWRTGSAYDRFHDTPQSGNDNAVNLRGGVALTDRIALEGGDAFESFVAPNDFYDRQLHRAGARMVFDATSSLQLALCYSYQEGYVISYAVPPRPD